MQSAKNIKEYRIQVKESLANRFLRQAMDNFAVAYRGARPRVFADLDLAALVREIAEAKDEALGRLDELFETFKAQAEGKGIHVHQARTADDANRLVAEIARQGGATRIVKSKSMTAEETLLNHHLEAEGLEVTETDLGEWIIQLRGEGPSHMVMPAIHLSRFQVADLFSSVTGRDQDSEIERLVKVARRELRHKFTTADLGVTGANFAVAETGTLGLVTNEGNARLVTTLPRIHVALVGIDKLIPSLHDALRILRILPRNATGQAITSYVTWITGTNQCSAAKDGKQEVHVIFLDNGRRQMVRDPEFRQVLRCVRCGACANVCPVYRMVGGHQYGHIYIGAIGLILTYFFHGREKTRNLVKNCINCGACREVCAAGIDLPNLIKSVLARIYQEEKPPMDSLLLGKVLRNRRMFHSLLKSARLLQKPLTAGTRYVRHLPQALIGDQQFRAIPALADRPFRDIWPAIRPASKPEAKYRAALFSGCLHDFVYPEQISAMVRIFEGAGADLAFPEQQSCCGLPVKMMGEMDAARSVARQNVLAMAPEKYDYIVTGCASCAAFLKNDYPELLAKDTDIQEKVRLFSEKIIDFSSFVVGIPKPGSEKFAPGAKKTAYHAPCHLCRSLKVVEPPRDLIRMAGLDYRPSEEEDVCCGFGGTYSAYFPEISKEILGKKLDHLVHSGAELLVTDCPGCIMQIRGGIEARGGGIQVCHIAEAVADNWRS